jgi:hypothetical protein
MRAARSHVAGAADGARRWRCFAHDAISLADYRFSPRHFRFAIFAAMPG